MKTAKMCVAALLAIIVMSSLVGCTEQRFGVIGQPIEVGDKTYTALVASDKDSCGINIKTLMIAESQMVPQQVLLPSQTDHRQHSHQAPPEQRSPRAHPIPEHQRPVAVCQPYQPQYVLRNEKLETRIINVNNAASDGIAVQALAGSGAALINAGGFIAGSAVRRPGHFSGGNNTLSQSQSQSQAQAQAQD